MGTYSRFEIIQVAGGNAVLFNNDFFNYEVVVGEENIRDFLGTSETRWYSWVEDMQQVSKEYPNTLFTVSRLREDGELAIYHFFNGEAEDAYGRFAFDEPTESLLRAAPDAEAQARLERRNSLQERTQELREALRATEQELAELGHLD